VQNEQKKKKSVISLLQSPRGGRRGDGNRGVCGYEEHSDVYRNFIFRLRLEKSLSASGRIGRNALDALCKGFSSIPCRIKNFPFFVSS
jgi:hypothetical protein